MCKVLQHFYYRRIIVTQNIQLNQSTGNGMIIKMGCNGGRGLIISRMLQGSKEMHIHIPGYYHNSSRMLTGGTLYPITADSHLIYIGLPLGLPLFLIILAYKAIGGLLRHCTNRASPKHIVLAKQLFRIFVSHWLIFTGEIQINIRHLIPIKA